MSLPTTHASKYRHLDYMFLSNLHWLPSAQIYHTAVKLELEGKEIVLVYGGLRVRNQQNILDRFAMPTYFEESTVPPI